MKKAYGRVKARAGIPKPMTRADPEALAAALRANLRRRKVQAREPQPSFGPDEEGDVVMPESDGGRPGAWVREGSKRL